MKPLKELILEAEAPQEIPMTKVYDEYDIHFNRWTAINAHGGDIDFKQQITNDKGNLIIPKGTVFQKDSKDFWKDFGHIKSITIEDVDGDHANYIEFRGTGYQVRGVEFNANDFRVSSGYNDDEWMEFAGCKFNIESSITFDEKDVKFQSCRGNCEIIRTDGWTQIESKGSTIKANILEWTNYRGMPGKTLTKILANAGIELRIGKGNKAEMEVVDPSKVGSLFTANQDNIWDVREMRCRVTTEFDELKRLKRKELNFTLTKKGSGYELTSFEEQKG